MVLCVDVVDVICNLQEVVIKLFNDRHGANYKISDFTEYNVMNIFPIQDAIAIKDMYGESGLYNKVKPIVGAQEALQKLINDGHQVYLVTAAIPKTYDEKVKFIHRYFPFIDDGHIVCMKHKWMFKCDIMIEDNYETLITKPYYYRILMDQPWNRSNKDYARDIRRCYNWDDILTAVNEINELE